MRDIEERICPPDLFPKPSVKDDGTFDWHFLEEPLNQKLTEKEMQTSPFLRQLLSTELTKEFFSTLYYKVMQTPRENLIIECKGLTRSGKSTVAIFLGKLISTWTGKEFTAENIFQNQSEFIYKIKDLQYGDTCIIDEQRSEAYGEGVVREYSQLSEIINICAKKCINMIFIYPPSFTNRNAPYGLETISKDMHSKYVKAYYHDLRRKAFGAGGIWPHGYVLIPKYQDRLYQEMPKSKWSEYRTKNFQERGYDFDSELEELYEAKKDKGIDEVMNLDSGIRDKKKMDIARELSKDDRFLGYKNQGLRSAYLQLMIDNKKIMQLAKSEYDTIINMALVLSKGEL
jgi:hypothetical protein